MSQSIQKPEGANAEGLPVRLVICLDGTGDTSNGSYSALDGNKSGAADSIYTIYLMTKAGTVTDTSGKKFFQRAGYFEGVGTVGTSDGSKPSMLVQSQGAFDGATGHGYLEILRAAYKMCCQELQPIPEGQHELLVFGFSRGAFIARALSSFLQHVGIIKHDGDLSDKEFEKKFEKVLLRYGMLTQKIIPTFWKKNATPKTAPVAELLDFCVPCPRIRLLGAFDTVKTTYPITRTGPRGPVYIDFQMDAPQLVDNFRHALALNEQRFLFNPDLWHLDASSESCSYLEAWFFGYHHDIGGGDSVQGLALWPLQWILHEASDLAGLVLDSEVYPYDVIFNGRDQPANVIETPHNVLLRMFDMITHHHSDPSLGLKLNKPFSFTFPVPRKYTKFLTQPPYSKWLRPKVFVHPSAYLVFDVSTEFRLQIFQWDYFQSFIQGRFKALPRDTAPWWETHTINSILKDNVAADHLNILVIGRRGTGKADMVRKIFGDPDIPATTTIHNPIRIAGNNKVKIYFSHGFDPKTGSDTQESVEAFISEHRNDTNSNTRLHALWFFLDATQDKISPSEKAFSEIDFGEIPIIVAFANEDKLLGKIQEKAMAAAKDPHLSFEQAKKALQALKDVALAFEHMAMATRKLTAQLGDAPIKKTVHAKNPREAPKNLLAETSTLLPDGATQLIAIKAQRLEVQPKIAFATEESIRAYVTWYMYRKDGVPRSLCRGSDDNGMKLTNMLMEPILSAFNIRFDGDTDLIISEIGAAWKSLDYSDNSESRLCDPAVRGDLILLCTLDTILIMTRALKHNHEGDECKKEEQTAGALTQDDIKRASQWYRGSKQAKTHTMVRDLLTADGMPKDKSIAALQMNVIETIELLTKRARKTWPVVTRVKDALGNVSGSGVLLISALGLVVCVGAFVASDGMGVVRIPHLPYLKGFQGQCLGVLAALGITGAFLGMGMKDIPKLVGGTR